MIGTLYKSFCKPAQSISVFSHLFDFDGTPVDSMPTYISAMLRILDENNVWSCDDFSTTKADPAIYLMATEKMGKRVEDVLFLDDNLNADKTTKNAGMPVCGVFDESSRDYTEEIKAATDYYIYDFSQLTSIDF